MVRTSEITKAISKESDKRGLGVKRISRDGDSLRYCFFKKDSELSELTAVEMLVDVSKYIEEFCPELSEKALYWIGKLEYKLESKRKKILKTHENKLKSNYAL